MKAACFHRWLFVFYPIPDMKKLLIVLVVLAAIGFGTYSYLYHDHRDIASETADFTVTVAELQSEFAADGNEATRKYADKTIQVEGKVTAVNPVEKAVTVDESLIASFSEKIPEVVSGKGISLKGRFVGYDDLLGELRLDQASVSDKP